MAKSEEEFPEQKQQAFADILIFTRMASILICEGNTQTRRKKAQNILEGHLIHSIEKEKGKIGIRKIKDLLPHLHIKPPKDKKKGVLIEDAHTMTPPAQNALLKTLEEHPEFLTFVLTTPHPKLVLPTVVSRCMVERAKGETEGDIKLAQEIISAQPAFRIELFEDKAGYGRDDVLSLLDSLETVLKSTKYNQKDIRKLTQIWEAKSVLRNPSSNTKLVIDRLLMSW